MLTLNGNPIEEIKGYRMFVLGFMFSQYETLRKLDTVIISRVEFDNVLVWNERLHANMLQEGKSLRKLRPANAKVPKPKEEDENAKNSAQPAK